MNLMLHIMFSVKIISVVFKKPFCCLQPKTQELLELLLLSLGIILCVQLEPNCYPLIFPSLSLSCLILLPVSLLSLSLSSPSLSLLSLPLSLLSFSLTPPFLSHSSLSLSLLPPIFLTPSSLSLTLIALSLSVSLLPLPS